MTQPHRTPPERLHVLAASLKLWLLDVCLWLSEWLGATLPRPWRIRLRADLRDALRAARVVVFLLAVARCGPPKPMHIDHVHVAPRGFRRAGVLDNDLRNVMRTVRLRGRTLAARLAALRDVLDDLEAWVARAVRRLMRGAHGARFVLIAPVCARLCALSFVDAVFADSS